MGQLRDCCCCIPLRIGTGIIGILYLIGSSITLAGLVVALVKLFSYEHYNGIRGSGEEFYYPAYESGMDIVYKVIFIIMCCLLGLQFIADLLLLVAAFERRSSLAGSWLIINMVLLILFIACLFVVSIFGFMFIEPLINVVSITPLVVAFVYLVVTIFAMTIVSGFYETVQYHPIQQCTPVFDEVKYKM